MNAKTRLILTILSVIFVGFLAWYFSDITKNILISIALSMMLMPLMEWLSSRKIKNSNSEMLFPRWFAALCTMLVVAVIFFGFILLVVPLIHQETKTISQIDPQQLTNYSNNIWLKIKYCLQQYGLVSQVENLEMELLAKAKLLINIDNLSATFSGVLSLFSSVFMTLFSIFFLTFFFLKDKKMFTDLLLSSFSQQNQQRVIRVFGKIRHLLSRYFIGILVQITIVMLLEFLGLLAFNVPNALLIAFLGGLLNIIPYLGPVIGTIIGCLLAVVSTLALGMYDDVIWSIVKVVVVFLAVNIIDNVVNQPLIFSNSVKAHPVEIFIVTICAGYLAGIGGMIIAIPVYTVLRIIMKEYLNEFSFIQNLTKNI